MGKRCKLIIAGDTDEEGSWSKQEFAKTMSKYDSIANRLKIFIYNVRHPHVDHPPMSTA